MGKTWRGPELCVDSDRACGVHLYVPSRTVRSVPDV